MTVFVRDPKVVAFDFDGTLTYGESFLRFLWFVTPWPRFLWICLRSLPVMVAYGLGRLPNDRAKARILDYSLKGRPLAGLQVQAAAFAREVIPALLRPQAVARLHGHQKQGHVCVLVSATLAIYLRPWAEEMGFDAVLATELEVDAAGRLTGRMATPNCHGPEKAARLLAHYGQSRILAAYGDTRGDHEMLAMAEQGHFRPWHS